jgi:predicted DNA-binding transcriptional regulator AlpA
MKMLSFERLQSDKGITWSRVHIDREEKAGRFPARVRLGGNTVCWVEAEIDMWLEHRASECRGIEPRDAGARGRAARRENAVRKPLRTAGQSAKTGNE